MLGTGLADWVLHRRREEEAVADRIERRLHMLMAVPAANAQDYMRENRESAEPTSTTAAAISRLASEPISLSARELAIIARIAAGATSAEIAEQLHISVHTVKNHRKNILRKAGCRNSGQLITRCTALGLV